MPRNLPDVHKLTLEDVDSLINFALDTRNEEMFRMYTDLKNQMKAAGTEAVYIESYSGEAEIHTTTDNIDRINSLTLEETIELMELAVELDDREMFEEYGKHRRAIEERGWNHVYLATYIDPHYEPGRVRDPSIELFTANPVGKIIRRASKKKEEE